MNITYHNDYPVPAPFYIVSILAFGGCINGIIFLLTKPIITKYYKRYRSYLSNRELLNYNKYFIENVEVTDEDFCCICLNDFNDKNNIKTLKCNHFFHSDCIYQWIHEKKLCPLCKTNIK